MEWLRLIDEPARESEKSERPRGYRMPYTSPEMGAACVEPLVNEYYSDGCYLWATLEQTDGDLEIEDASYQDAQEILPWADYLLSEYGLQEIVGCVGDVLEWSLHQGIAPGQPFLIYCEPPRTEKIWTDWGYEYDEEWEAWVVRKLPTEMGIRQYERIVSEVYSDRQKLLDATRSRR